MKDVDLDRLLQAAAKTKDDAPIEAPFGFDTRVIALWRANGNGASRAVARLVRRVALVAAAVMVATTIGAYREVKQSRDLGESLTGEANEFAIADSVIQDEFPQ
jgi:hypothetical protein